jgi:Flp pilus assembly protein CpaB
MLCRKDAVPLLAIALGTAVSVGLTALLLREPPEVATVVARRSVPVVVAARDMTVGTVVAPEDPKIVDWPQNARGRFAFASTPDQVVGLVVAQPVKLNEPMRADLFRGLAPATTGPRPEPRVEGLRGRAPGGAATSPRR